MNERLEWGLGVFQESQLSLSIEGFEHGGACAMDEATDAFTLIQGQISYRIAADQVEVPGHWRRGRLMEKRDIGALLLVWCTQDKL